MSSSFGLGERRRVLLVDDDCVQLKLNRLRLMEAGFEVDTAGGADEALASARLRTPDAIMSDVLMGDLDGFGLCRLLREQPSLDAVPVILLSSHYREETDRQLAKRVGAAALVLRTHDFSAELDALEQSLVHRVTASPPADRALYEEHLRTNANQMSRLLSQAKNAEERYLTLFKNAYDAITLLGLDGTILEANERWRTVLGVDPEQLVGKHISAFVAPGAENADVEHHQRSALPLLRPDGGLVYMEFSNSVIEIDGIPTVVSIGRDVTEQVTAAQRLAAAEEKYRSLVERLPDVIWTCGADGTITFMTRNAEEILGYSPEETSGLTFDEPAVREAFRKLIADGSSFDVEYRHQHKAGHWIWVRNRSTAIYDKDGAKCVEGMISDVTERKRLEESLRQSQKMEAIGQLTGGIAHDFNNILAAILANSHFLLADLAENDPRRADAEDIRQAAQRAAALTRQLLAFSRRQALEPRLMDLNSTVGGLEKMLRRLIGEDIDFAVLPGAELGAVRVDVGELEQVVMNLVVNARDAMPMGGKLTIETSNVELDEHAASQISAAAGSYVMLAVTDSGCGMTAEVRRRIFEPFFTTKEVGKGTGLGLSTCYGIVKQSGGYIWVYSEVGHGTVFKIYLPRVDIEPEVVRSPAAIEVRGTETILVVEDDHRLRAAVCRMLEPLGYRVLVARTGPEAIELAAQHRGAIDLLLSDVIMPQVSGPEVAEHIRAIGSPIRTLFMSGYTDHAILRNGALQAELNFIQKPFAPETLAKTVRDVLDAPTAR